MQKLVEPAVPDRVIKGFEDRYHRTFDLAPFDGEWGNTHRYKHDGIQQRWEGWRDGYLAVISPALTAHPKIVELVARLTEYAKDWRDRAADASIVEEAATALTALAALSPLPAPEPTEGIAELVGRLNEQCRIEKQRTSAMSLTIAERASANYRDQLCAEAATALTAIQAERDTQDAAIKLVSHSNDSHLEELGRVIMACPQGMRTSPASDGVKQLRAALDRLQAELAAMKEGAAVAWRGVVDGRTAFLCRTNDEVARLAADYDAVIEPLFTHPAPADKGVVECASEDCGQPATRYYAKHGVGSHHCEECYQRIVAIAASPAEGDGR
jgi:hypothetical protein